MSKLISDFLQMRGDRVPLGELHLIRDLEWKQRVVMRTSMSEEELLKAAIALASGIVENHHLEWEKQNGNATEQ